ncbi:MAG: DMT family transporter [Chloroflexota bacterium]
MWKKTFWQPSPHGLAVLQALFVTFLWSTSWVLIKIGLGEIPPITFAGLRYGLAAIILLPLFLRTKGLNDLRSLPGGIWAQLIGLGIVHYALTQGAQFMSLSYLPALTVNLLWGFSPILVAIFGIKLLAEQPSGWQWTGVAISIMGIAVYFYPVNFITGQSIGFIAAVIGILANVLSTIVGRSINRNKQLSPLTITTVSMGIGAILLLSTGLTIQGMPTLDWQSWAIIVWLSVINTAFAFTLWNYTLQRLSAIESSIINNAMGIQIPILAILFLGERLTMRQFVGLIVMILGVLLVQFRRR